jgi:hypothetical protein
VLNVGIMEAILSGFYLSHDKFFEIIRNIFGQPTLNGFIEIVDCLEMRCLLISVKFFFSIRKKNNMVHKIVMHFSGIVLQLNGKNVPSSYFQFSKNANFMSNLRV